MKLSGLVASALGPGEYEVDKKVETGGAAHRIVSEFPLSYPLSSEDCFKEEGRFQKSNLSFIESASESKGLNNRFSDQRASCRGGGGR